MDNSKLNKKPKPVKTEEDILKDKLLKDKKSKYGQFDTGNEECKFTIDEIKKFTNLYGNVLEPSFGIGNFVNELMKEDVSIDACEIDGGIYKPINGVNTFNCDFILHEFNKTYDFIIGNPPYIELTYSYYIKDEIKKLNKLYDFKNRGRVNLIHLFYDKCFSLLNDNGVIAFLLPTTILNSPWYNDIRKKIYDEYTVLSMVENVPFKDVSINVCLLIIQKKIDSTHNFIIKNDDFYVISNFKKGENQITLKDRGFKCQIGNILWYRIKENLSKEDGERVLIYTNNIGCGNLTLIKDLKTKLKGKFQYINNNDSNIISNCIITPRVISKTFKHFLILDNKRYVFENHVLIITHEDVEMLKELNDYMVNFSYEFSKFFNSTNLTAKELLNFSY
jgi:hypothetical protein